MTHADDTSSAAETHDPTPQLLLPTPTPSLLVLPLPPDVQDPPHHSLLTLLILLPPLLLHGHPFTPDVRRLRQRVLRAWGCSSTGVGPLPPTTRCRSPGRPLKWDWYWCIALVLVRVLEEIVCVRSRINRMLAHVHLRMFTRNYYYCVRESITRDDAPNAHQTTTRAKLGFDQ